MQAITFKRAPYLLSCLSLFLVGCLFSLSACEKAPTLATPKPEFLSYDTIKAWDITTFAAWGEKPQLFYDSLGKEIDLLTFAKKTGVNTLRLRILTGKPSYPHATINQLLAFAKKAKEHRFALWLDFHYSDVWADPGNQSTPAQWVKLSLSDLTDSMQDYTFEVVKLFTEQGTEPSIVQIGNEISPGMLWPVGKFNGKSDEANTLAKLFNAGAEGAKRAAPNTKIMLHLAGSANTITWITGYFQQAPFNFDLWGFSYYGFWHGCETSIFLNACEAISNNTKKPFVIAETAQPFTLAWLDQCHNAIGNANQLCSGFAANPQSQLNWLSMLWSSGKLKNNFRGMAYWEPAFVTQKEFSCDSQLNGGGSGWENMCLFDFNHHALPAAYFNWK